MTKNKKLWLINGIAFLLAFLVGLYYAVPYFQKPNVSVRAISVLEEPVDYEHFFYENGLENVDMYVEEETNSIFLSFRKIIDGSIAEEDIGIECSLDEDITLQFMFEYSADTNDFYFLVDTYAFPSYYEGHERLSGVPFLTEEGEIDIGFATEDGPVFLSDFDENMLLQNCGWFSRALKKVALAATVVAVTAAVVAVAVVVAPAVVAAATAIGSAVVGTSAGATAIAALGAAATAGAAAISTTTFAIAAATATIAACVALVAEIAEEYVELTDTFAQSTEEEVRSNKAWDGPIYYPCLRVGEGIKLQVSPFPVNDEVAVAWIKLGGNMYTYFSDDAAGILELAGYVPGLNHAEMDIEVGQYPHYHPFLDNVEVKIAGDGRQVYGPKHSIHSFYGRRK